MARLFFVGQDRDPFELLAGQTTIGRSVHADVVVDLPDISRLHARITRTACGYFLEDLGSKKGTRLNGQSLTAGTLLKNSDEIEMSGVLLRVEGILPHEFEDETVVDDMDSPCKDLPEQTESSVPPPVPEPSHKPVDATEINVSEADAVGGPIDAPAVIQQEPALPVVDDDDQTRVASSIPVAGTGGETVVDRARGTARPRFLIFCDNEQVGDFQMKGRQSTVGRGADADMRLESGFVSRLHVRLVADDGDISVVNLSKKNKTFVNGREVEQAVLKPGDVIAMANVKLLHLPPGGAFDRKEIESALRRGQPIPARVRRLRKVIAVVGILTLAVLVASLFLKKPEKKPAAPMPSPSAASGISPRERVQQAINDRDWHQALAVVRQSGAEWPEARELQTQVEQEMTNREKFIQIDDLTGKNQWEKALALAGEVSDDSVYSMLIQELFRNRGGKLAAQYLTEAQRQAKSTKDRDKAVGRLKLVQRLDPANEEAERLLQRLLSAGPRDKSSAKAGGASVNDEIRVRLEAGVDAYLQGDWDDAVAKLSALKNRVSAAEDETLNISATLGGIQNVQKYYDRGFTARNQGQALEAVNHWEKMFGAASRIAGGRVPLALARVRSEVVAYYLSQARQLLAQKDMRGAARVLKRVLSFDPGNTEAMTAFAAVGVQAKALYDRGAALRAGEGGCAQAAPLFKQALELTAGNDPLNQKALKELADCQ